VGQNCYEKEPDMNTRMTMSMLFLGAAAQAATVTWDGGGTDNNWTTPANWSGDAAPAAGDTLAFSGGTRTATANT